MHPRFGAYIVAMATLCAPHALSAQRDSTVSAPSRTSLGLSAVGAMTVHGGWASVQRGYRAASAGATLDFGHFASNKVRLVTDVTYMLTAPHEERVEDEGRTYRDVFRDLSADISIAVHPIAPTTRFSPYVSGGVGVHVLSSSFGSTVIDTRYNTNNFGVVAAAGARLRVGGSGRRGLQVEMRAVNARNVRRVSVHLGVAALFNDLVRR